MFCARCSEWRSEIVFPRRPRLFLELYTEETMYASSPDTSSQSNTRMFRRKRERALGVAKHVTTPQQQEDEMAQKFHRIRSSVLR
jgi:hypothetical protein